MWTLLRRSLALIGLLLGLAIVGGLLFLRTEQFRSLARQQILDALNTSLAGQVSLERLEGTLWGSLVLHQVHLEHQGRDRAPHSPADRRGIGCCPCSTARLEVSDISLVDPFIRLNQPGRWGWGRRCLKPSRQPPQRESPQNPPGLSIGLENLTIENGRLVCSAEGTEACHLNDAPS